jgi:hypothetical protein
MSITSFYIADPVNYTYEDCSANNTANNLGWLLVKGSTIRINTDRTPSSSSDSAYKGEICWDSNYLYIAVDTNTWKRVGLSSF